jgi:RNA polymerase sigma-B factor
MMATTTAFAQSDKQLTARVPRFTGESDEIRSRPDERDQLWDLLDSLPAEHPARREVRNEIVTAHMPLVIYLARRYIGRGEKLDDLIQVGSIGLIKSVDRFDRSHGVAFATFATPTIVGEIKRHFRDKTWMVRVPRSLQELRVHLATAREQLSHQLSRSPTITELAQYMDLSEEQVLEAFDAANAYSATSLDAPTAGESGSPQSLADQLGATDAALELVELRHCVAPLLDVLPARERQILFLRFFRDKTQTEIAQELGISQMHVSRLLSQTLNQLRDKLAADISAN